MNKKIFIVIIFFLLLIGVSIASIFIYNKEPILERNMSEDIKAWLVEETLTRSGCTIVIREGEPPRGVGEPEFWDYTIDVLENNKWIELPLKPGAKLPDFAGNAAIEVSFFPKSLIDPENAFGREGEIDVEVNFEELYGRLENGEYRIVKWKGCYPEWKYFYIPFTIDDTIK